ncbi:hypothetical protein EWM64_g303 [Hericium alpestre]|uniref:Transcription factor spt8 beta-propeller domain-containing protein n=1 Tax=Hericium alpestre TaxID=135208 RepID=A0A4Z0AD07_9AGAM|nr:hypothetical protein EWM64_g303 [Hericium alpestre]
MANTDSDPEDDGENVEDVDFDAEDVEDEIDEDILDAIEAGAEEASDGDQDSEEDDSDDGSDDDDEDEEAPAASQASALAAGQATTTPAEPPPASKAPTAPSRAPSLSPALARRALLRPAVPFPKSYTVEAICALPHPVPTHSLAATPCMLHLLTGSDDGYVRDYDIFSAVNGKVFLTAPQRHHAGVVEGILKAGQIRSWWENPGARSNVGDLELAPVHSLAIHGDALWGLAGSNAGNINLYTIRHEPGRIFHTMEAHRGPVSALCLQHDEKGFFSAGWDGNALQWDLNTGQIVRRFRTHGAQVAALQVRPLTSTYPTTPSPYHLSMLDSVQPTNQETAPLNEVSQPATSYSATQETAFTATSTTLTNFSDAPAQSAQNPSESTIAPTTQATDADAKSDTSYDPLFDDEPDAEGEPDTSPPSPSGQQSTQASTTGPTTASGPMLHLPTPASFGSTPAPKTVSAAAPAPKNAPPVLDYTSFAAFSPDIMMTAYMDGQEDYG